MASEWNTYLLRITAGATGSEIARRVGVSGSKVSYWKKGSRPPTAREAVSVSRAYSRPPLEGLVAAGYLTADEIPEHLTIQQSGLASFTDAELAAEILHRAEQRD